MRESRTLKSRNQYDLLPAKTYQPKLKRKVRKVSAVGFLEAAFPPRVPDVPTSCLSLLSTSWLNKPNSPKSASLTPLSLPISVSLYPLKVRQRYIAIARASFSYPCAFFPSSSTLFRYTFAVAPTISKPTIEKSISDCQLLKVNSRLDTISPISNPSVLRV